MYSDLIGTQGRRRNGDDPNERDELNATSNSSQASALEDDVLMALPKRKGSVPIRRNANPNPNPNPNPKP